MQTYSTLLALFNRAVLQLVIGGTVLVHQLTATLGPYCGGGKHLNILSCLKFALTVIYIIGNENNQSEQFNGVLQTMFAFINGNKFRIDFTFNFKLAISANVLEYDRKNNKKEIE